MEATGKDMGIICGPSGEPKAMVKFMAYFGRLGELGLNRLVISSAFGKDGKASRSAACILQAGGHPTSMTIMIKFRSLNGT